MQAGDILEFVRQRPFKPFRITLTDGRTYQIHHPDLAMVGKSTVIVGVPSSNDPDHLFERAVHIDLLHIMEAEPLPAPATPANN